MIDTKDRIAPLDYLISSLISNWVCAHHNIEPELLNFWSDLIQVTIDARIERLKRKP